MTNNEQLLQEVARVLFDDEVELDRKVHQVGMLREAHPELNASIDHFFIQQRDNQRQATKEAESLIAEQKLMIHDLTSPPLLEALFLGRVEMANGTSLARVSVAGGERLITVADGVDIQTLAPAELVYLSAEANVILHKAEPCPGPGGCAVVERWTDDGRLIVNERDQQLVLRVAAGLFPEAVKPGDRVLLDSKTGMVVERIEGGETQQYAAGEVATDVSTHALAGYEEIRSGILRRVTYAITHPDTADVYGVGRQNDRILFIGPPGCGKTTSARVLAAAVQQESGGNCRIVKINGAEFYSPWVGQTEQNIKGLVHELAAAESGWSILFLDEVDAIARSRGTHSNVHSDRFLNTLLGELEGFEGQARIIVVAATNRVDMLDAAFRDRFAWEIRIPRPRMESARAIFAHHLNNAYPYRINGKSLEETRLGIIETAVARLYDPNGDTGLATLRFRDGRTRSVVARELMSGRLIEQICKDAREAAFQRVIEGGEEGITEGDMVIAVEHAIDRLRGTLTRHNVHSYLNDLPQDLDVVAVEVTTPAVSKKHYLQ